MPLNAIKLAGASKNNKLPGLTYLQSMTQSFSRGFFTLNASERRQRQINFNLFKYQKMNFRMPGSSGGSKKKDLYCKLKAN
jgi:hypothetical protein